MRKKVDWEFEEWAGCDKDGIPLDLFRLKVPVNASVKERFALLLMALVEMGEREGLSTEEALAKVRKVVYKVRAEFLEGKYDD